jgi:hypothetical protein
MSIQLGVGTHPIRLDVMLRAGLPFEQFLPVSGADGVPADQTSWVVATSVLDREGGQAIGALTVVKELTGLTLKATSAQTTQWAAGGWPLYSPWFLNSVHPSGDPVFAVAGWVSLYR